jgi:erythromycin esterase-like protein
MNLIVDVFTFFKYPKPMSTSVTIESGQTRMDRMNQAIETSQQNVRNVINIVNENYRNFLVANVSYHLHLRELAEQAGDLATTMHHQVMAETYQSLLERTAYSGSPLQ